MNFFRATEQEPQAAAAASAPSAAPEALEAREVPEAPTAPPAMEYELSAIDLYMKDGHRWGWVATNGQRTSDWLNHTETLPVRGVTALGAPDPEIPPPQGDASRAAEVTTVKAEDILFVIPPPLPANRHLRLHRRRVHISVMIGDVKISGQAHIRPGAEVGEHIFRSGRRFVPLTDVEVHLDDDSPVWQLPVVIINGSAVRDVGGMHDGQVTAGPASAAADELANFPAHPAMMPAPTESSAETTADEPAAANDAVEASAVEVPAADAPIAAEADGLGSRNTILLTALELLLAEGIIDVVEFQTKRAAVLAE